MKSKNEKQGFERDTFELPISSTDVSFFDGARGVVLDYSDNSKQKEAYTVYRLPERAKRTEIERDLRKDSRTRTLMYFGVFLHN
jgi:hypothetical protein